VFFRVLSTFFIVVLGWVLFRAQNIGQALNFFKKMFSFSVKEFYFSTHLISILVIAIILSFIPLFYKTQKPALDNNPVNISFKRTLLNVVVILVFMMLCIGEITSSDFNPFIYFKF
jgi:alginate O-acetyltransferase complex protein AlgI